MMPTKPFWLDLEGSTGQARRLSKHFTIEAGGSRFGNYDYRQGTKKRIFEEWRIGAVAG